MTNTASDVIDRLAALIDERRAPLCVGLDPVVERIPEAIRTHREPAAALEAFSRGVIEAVEGVACAVKPQAACFERWGSPGFAALERTIWAAREAGLFVLLDAKRGDIGTSAAHYAASATAMGADAVTVNAYLGPSGIRPFLDAGLAVFALVRTSNPDSDAIQASTLRDGRTVAERVAETIAQLGAEYRGANGLSALGAVVGATKTDATAKPSPSALRAAMPDQVFLTPGIGAQGASPEDLRPLARPGAATPGALGLLATASRSVTYPDFAQHDDAGTALAEEAWRTAVRSEAQALAAQLRDALA